MYSAQFTRNKRTRMPRAITPFHGHCFLRLSSFEKWKENCHCLLFNKVKISFMFLIKTASLANQPLLSF